MEKDLEQRTKRFALAIIKFSSSLPRTREIDILMRQLIRCATSIGANYREANRGVSRADFANNIGTVQKEAAETQYCSSLSSNPVLLMITVHRSCYRSHQNCSRSSRASGKS